MELGLRYSQREEIKEEKVDDAILMAEVRSFFCIFFCAIIIVFFAIVFVFDCDGNR